jgi:hypothetical protein
LHSGQKPGKEDIKACLEIAKTYKKYNRVRAMLAGKSEAKILEPATASSPIISKAGEERGGAGGQYSDLEIREDAVQVSTPRTTKVSSIRRPSPPHPNTLDPYDPPTSASPRSYIATAIGPTPQRDGKILGLFDMLSNSGSSSRATPSVGKRNLDTLVQRDSDVYSEQVVAQTPSRKRVRSGGRGGDTLDILDLNSPKKNQRHSKTPTSEGKKYMLNQFFATPSTLRFGTIAKEQDALYGGQPTDRDASPRRTPLRAHVLGRRADSATETETLALDTTPAYLRRSFSFKDRLLSASASNNMSSNSQKTDLSSPTSTPAGPPTLRRYKCGPKPLSEIVRVLRQMDDERHDDDWDALRETESGQTNILVRESQPTTIAARTMERGTTQEVIVGDEHRVSQKVWKKKGQKRTTRRTNMRPVKIKPKKENQWVAVDSENEDWDELEAAEEKHDAIQQSKPAMKDEESNVPAASLSPSRDREFETKDIAVDREIDKPDGSDAGFEPESNYHEVDNCDEISESKAAGNTIRDVGSSAEATEPISEKAKHKHKNVAGKAKGKGPFINPNAVSHQNFRSLKIRHKNAKSRSGRRRFEVKRR